LQYFCIVFDSKNFFLKKEHRRSPTEVIQEKHLSQSNMSAFFGFLFFISFILLIIGLIKPNWVVFWKKEKSRKQVFIGYGIAIVVFFWISIVFVDNWENGKEAFSKKNWGSAVTNLSAVKNTDENYAEAQRMLDSAKVELRKEDEIKLAQKAEKEAKKNQEKLEKEQQKVAEQAKSENKNVELPSPERQIQIEFQQKRATFKRQYQSGKNEIQKSGTYSEINEWSLKFAEKSKFIFKNWTGKVTSIETNKGGSMAALKIEAEFFGITIEYRTDHVSFMPDENLVIKKGTKIYNQLSTLQEGDTVEFSFQFIPDQERGLKEGSTTESGTACNPEFVVKFIDLKKQ
jgi:hypothetical protein